MDEYLVPNAQIERLIKEYLKYDSLVIAFDFDNTVYDFHKKGHTYTKVIELLRRLKDELHCTLICFTGNEDEAFVWKYCEDNGIPIDKLNENCDFFKSTSRKIYYNAFLDDRAGLIQVYQELDLLIKIVKADV